MKVAETGLQSQSSDGSMIPGRNGPYNDIETPVRNTSHWAITFVKAFQLTSEEKFKKAALACTEYLSGQKARPYGKTFWHRKSDSKDECNGLIGQAWSIEAIAIASVSESEPTLPASAIFNPPVNVACCENVTLPSEAIAIASKSEAEPIFPASAITTLPVLVIVPLDNAVTVRVSVAELNVRPAAVFGAKLPLAPVANNGADGGIIVDYDPFTKEYFSYIRPSGVGRRAIGISLSLIHI